MNKDEQKWITFEIENGWICVMPEKDTKPHAKIVLIEPGGNQFAQVAGWDCPCRPHVDWMNKMIVHNSFLENDTRNTTDTKTTPCL